MIVKNGAQLFQERTQGMLFASKGNQNIEKIKRKFHTSLSISPKSVSIPNLSKNNHSKKIFKKCY